MDLYLIKRPGHVNAGLVESMVVAAEDRMRALGVSATAFPDTEAGHRERDEWSTRFVRDVEYIGEARPANRPAGVLVASRKVVTA